MVSVASNVRLSNIITSRPCDLSRVTKVYLGHQVTTLMMMLKVEVGVTVFRMITVVARGRLWEEAATCLIVRMIIKIVLLYIILFGKFRPVHVSQFLL